MPIPGPSPFGRGVVVEVGAAVPAAWSGVARVTIDEAALADPAPVVARLHDAWMHRAPLVVALAVDPGRFRQPESIRDEPWRLSPDTEPWFDRLHFLVWANTYDAREGEPTWWWGVKAARLEDGATATPAGPGDVRRADGSPAWIDGGPRRPWAAVDVEGLDVIHSESVELGALRAIPAPAEPAADLAADQLAAVAHLAGPSRVIAPAGSGKTRVLTERLRHLHRDRGYERPATLAVAYNKQAQLEMEARTADFGPRVRTLNSLGLWVLAEHRGSSPPVLDERDIRRIVERLVPGRRPRRSNTDPIGPYVESLGLIRLGLVDPEIVEASRDDVPGLAELFPRYRAHLGERAVVDFDEQIYGAVEVLLRDGAFRRSLQRSSRHLLVDEFQDLTSAHVLLVRLLALPGLDVFGVGDDDQCIYGHAGADPRFLIDYERLFPGAVAHPLRVNYRCPVEVVDAARTLLGYNDRRVPKEIVAGPASEPGPGALRVIEHGAAEAAATALGVVRHWLHEPGVAPSSIAVLARVNSLLLAPHLALHEAGIPVSSVLHPDVLERTGVRAALAYLRLAATPDAMAAADIVEILRRPTRGLPPWFSDRLERRARWSPSRVRGVAASMPDKDAVKVERLADDLELVATAGRAGTVRDVLVTVRDAVGLGSAMTLLDRTGGGQGSSHLDDLEGLLGVADLHPALDGFEAWLRGAFRREADPRGVTLSTIHRVKGREWDRVALFGVSDGVVPHRLAVDLEEERRVLHVGITRGRSRVVVLADRSRRSQFLDELAGTATRRPGRAVRPETDRDATRTRRPSEPTAVVPLTGAAGDAAAALRTWRLERAKRDGVPAYVVLNDRHLLGIAAARPSSARELAACDGIGPTKLERYGDEILALLELLAD
jgi:DNA helicase-2/ATP-dependent DNA helicase PcrA